MTTFFPPYLFIATFKKKETKKKWIWMPLARNKKNAAATLIPSEIAPLLG